MKGEKRTVERVTLKGTDPQHTNASERRIRGVAPQASRPHVLLVEDQANVAKALRKTLEKWFDVTWARNYDEAVAGFSTQDFSALIADVRLDGLSGLEVLEKFRELHPRTPAMILTAYSDDADSVRAWEPRAHSVAKPITTLRLQVFVKNARPEPLPFAEALTYTLGNWKVRYGLSEAEEQVLRYAARGDSIDDIAKVRGTTTATLIAQLGSACRKTRDHSSGKLTARLLREVAGQPPAGDDFPVRKRSGEFEIALQQSNALPLTALSEREREVVAQLSQGKSPKEIAYDLGIAHSTVRTIARRAKSKLGER